MHSQDHLLVINILDKVNKAPTQIKPVKWYCPWRHFRPQKEVPIYKVAAVFKFHCLYSLCWTQWNYFPRLCWTQALCLDLRSSLGSSGSNTQVVSEMCSVGPSPHELQTTSNYHFFSYFPHLSNLKLSFVHFCYNSTLHNMANLAPVCSYTISIAWKTAGVGGNIVNVYLAELHILKVAVYLAQQLVWTWWQTKLIVFIGKNIKRHH